MRVNGCRMKMLKKMHFSENIKYKFINKTFFFLIAGQ